MADATLTIEPIVFDFDLIMGQDLTFPVTYTIDGVVDSMDTATLRMEVRPLEWGNPIDVLTSENTRLPITGVNAYSMVFPAVISAAYPVDADEKQFTYRLTRTFDSLTERIYQGTITVKR